jgi:hypothetical protein
MRADELLAHNETLGTVLAAVLLVIWWKNRAFARDLTRNADRGWSTVTKMALVSLIGFIAWASFFDNWRQFTAIPWRASRVYASQRVQIDPPSESVRAVTFVLLSVALVLVACLVARHVGGYILQLLIAAGAFLAWIPFFVLRQRFTLNLAMGMDGSWKSPEDIAAYLTFVVLSWGFDIGLILVSFAFLAALTALPVTLVLDILRLRRPRITAEAQPFFNAIGGRTAR